MSLPLSLLADALVAVLLVATIVTSVRLSRRMARLKADETHMRQTIAELIVATDSAERAITGLRATVADCDRTLGDNLRVAEATTARLGEHVAAGEAVMARLGRIAEATRKAGLGARRDRGAASPGAGESLQAAIQAAREVAERATARVGRAA